MDTPAKQNVFLGIMFSLLMISGVIVYYRYVVLEDFSFFLTEGDIPERFDINSYK